MKKSTNFSAEKGRRLKIFATIFAAIFALIALATGLALKNYGGGRTDLTQTTAAATAPTDTSKYWTDEAAWSAAGKDFNNYTLSGSGGQGDPYLIQNEWDLAYLSWTIYTNNPILASHVSSLYYYSGTYFKQTADLDLSAYYWQPIGIRYLRDGSSASRSFSGCYDGGSHTVSGVFTPAGEGNGYSYQGLFGYVCDRSSTNLATISNVGVIDSFVQGDSYVGGVVGRAIDSAVTNCYNTGSVSGSGNRVGGVVGSLDGTVTNCYNTGSVEGYRYVGGVVGRAYSGSSSSRTIMNCYNTGLVSGSDDVGGVVGYTDRGTVINCYNIGSVSGSGNIGGVVGYATSNSVSNTYYGGNCTLDVGIGSGAVSGSAVKIDKPAEEWAKNQDWYSANAVNSDGSLVWSADSPWDFETVWKIVRAPDYISTNNGYPVLQGVGGSQVIYWTDEAAWSAAGKDFNNYTLSGSGGQGDPYLIQSEWDLAYLSWTIYTKNPIETSHVSSSRYYSGIYFKQTADLDLSAYYWQPIGIHDLRDGTSARRYFSGSYDGGSHTVSGLYTPAGESFGYYYQGLFGYVYGQSSTNLATISNVGVIDSFVQGDSYVGGVVGNAYRGTVENCYNTGSVSGSGSDVGGVVGHAQGASTVKNCYNTGSVNASSNCVGGVVGALNGTVTNCYNTGSIKGSDSVGGVVGWDYGSRTVTNCYNTGSIKGSDSVGGVVGETYRDSTIKNCYNTGTVSGQGYYVGGVLGNAAGNSTIKNCYNTGSVSGTSNVGGVVGSGSATNCYNTGSVSGSSDSVGGVVGYADSSTISNTYYGGDCTLDVGIGEGSGSAVKIVKPVEEWAKNKEWYSADAVNSDGGPVWSDDSLWNFETVWEFVENAPDCATNNGYPVLQGVGGNNQVIYWADEAVWSAAGKDFNNYTLSGSGSQEDPYLIQNEWDLAYLSWTIYTNHPIEASHASGSYYYSGKYFEQTADLDLSAYYWQPIGISRLRNSTSASRYFSGSYDGGGHTVSGLYTPAGTGDGYSYQGLFGCVRGQSSTNKATISYVGVIDSFVQGERRVGGVVGYASGSITITNCYNTGLIESSSSSYSYVGGVVGYAYGSSSRSCTIINCYNTGSVEGSDYYVGGVVGYAYSGSIIKNCYNTGSVNASSNCVGGVVGYASSSTITNCYNTGSVSSSGSQVGGVVGFTYAIVENCYNTGSVSGEEFVGGIVGTVSDSAAVTNCGFEGVINGSSSVGAIVGDIYVASATISNCYAVAESDSEISLVGSNSGNGTIENIVGIITSGGTSKKVYTGSDFSGFAWLNFDSSPVPKGLSLAGQFQEPPAEYAGNSNWILTKMQSEGWSAI